MAAFGAMVDQATRVIEEDAVYDPVDLAGAALTDRTAEIVAEVNAWSALDDSSPYVASSKSITVSVDGIPAATIVLWEAEWLAKGYTTTTPTPGLRKIASV